MSEKDDTKREPMGSVHSRYEGLGRRVLRWNEKDAREMNRKGLVHRRDEKPRRNLHKVNW